jgi:hypothetical protein
MKKICEQYYIIKTKEKKGIEMLYNGTYYISNEDKNTYFSNDKY